MRLIDADLLIEAIRNHCENVHCEVVALNDFYRLAHEHVIDVVNIQKTAFEMEKVLAELKDNCDIYSVKYYQENVDVKAVQIDDAIDILKRGGIE